MKSSRNIGIVTWDYEKPKGGLGRAMQQLAKALRNIDHDIEFDVKTLIPETSHKWTKKFGLHPMFSISLIGSLARWIRKTKRNLILFPCGPGGIWLFRKPKNCITVAIVYHTYLQQVRSVPGQWWKRIFLPFERRSLNIADRVFCYAEDTKSVLEKDYKLPPDKIYLLPQILLLQQWLGASGEKEQGLCVCIARLEQRKGVPFLLDVWKKLQEKSPQANLVIVGDGVQARKVDRIISRDHLSAVRAINLDQEELIALVKRAQLVLCPSYLEGFGLVVVEAMAAGTLVLASDVDGLRSLIDNEQTGLLFPMGDTDAWVRAIENQLTHPETGEHMMVNARLKVQERFDTERSIQTLHECLETL